MVSEFAEAYNRRHELAQEWKNQGKRILGYFCNYSPEEIIYAADIIPVRVRGGTENVELVDAHLPAYCCSFIRTALEQALKGKYSYLDGAVFPKSCDMTRVLPSIWKRNMNPSFEYFIPVPGRISDEAVDFLEHELGVFKEALEAYAGRRIEEAELRQAIRAYNTNRELMSRVYELTLSDAPHFKGSDLLAIELSGLIMPKDQHNEMLRRLLDNPPRTEQGDGFKRLMLVGNTFETIEMLKVIEGAGGNMVIDDLDIGTRYYTTLVDESKPPLRALAERYVRKVPCPCKHPTQARMEHILKLAGEYRVQGVILVNQKYCDSHLYDRPWIEGTLKEHGFPVLFVEHSDIGWAGGKFRTMAEAFMEMMG